MPVGLGEQLSPVFGVGDGTEEFLNSFTVTIGTHQFNYTGKPLNNTSECAIGNHFCILPEGVVDYRGRDM